MHIYPIAIPYSHSIPNITQCSNHTSILYINIHVEKLWTQYVKQCLINVDYYQYEPERNYWTSGEQQEDGKWHWKNGGQILTGPWHQGYPVIDGVSRHIQIHYYTVDLINVVNSSLGVTVCEPRHLPEGML